MPPFITRLSTGIVLLAGLGVDWAGLRADPVAPPLSTFDYRGVTLEGGRMGQQYDQVRRDYLAIPNDGLLKSFRQRAGRPAPGTGLGEFYDSGLFNIFGQVISGLSRFYAGSGEAACREKANVLVHEWALCIAEDGFFFNARPAPSPHYTYEKMVGGLVDNYVYCGNQEARECLARITGWARKNLSRNRHPWCMEWFTLGENLYRAYRATGEPEYLDFAREWEYTHYWNLFTRKPGDIFKNPPREAGQAISFHAYSHVNTFSSAAAAYETTGDERYLQIIRNAWTYLQENQVFATGGYGPFERLMPRTELLASLDNPFITKHFETQCGSWAAFKLSKYLMRFTGDGTCGDWVERLTLNGIGASLPASDGRVMYESDYHLGGAVKFNTRESWTCCAGTRSMAIADYADQVFFHDADHLYVNLFTPASVRWIAHQPPVTLRQRTDFPASDRIDLVVATPKPARFGLRIRRPRWLAGAARAALNGEPVQLADAPGHWFGLEREWNDGDHLAITMPMKLTWESMDASRTYPGVALYGPVVLAIGSRSHSPAQALDPAHLSETLTPIDGEALHFRLNAEPTLLARPFYEFGPAERYFVYLDPRWSDRISARDFEFHGKWVWGTSNEAGAWAECAFSGPSVQWLGRRGDNAGMARVSIDGRDLATVDQYAQAAGSEVSWSQSDLSAGPHRLRITVLPEKNPAASDHFINIAGLRGNPRTD